VALIRPAVPEPGGTWVDLGAGEGLFTRALAGLLGASGRVYALDRDPRAVAALERLARNRRGGLALVTPVMGDFLRLDEVRILPPEGWDGALFANALHFVPEVAPVLAPVVRRLRGSGRVTVVEYARRRANPWVPHPVSVGALEDAARTLGLGRPIVVAERPSRFGGAIYCAVMSLDGEGGSESGAPRPVRGVG
jgi:SAM-dependent methyltransferase